MGLRDFFTNRKDATQKNITAQYAPAVMDAPYGSFWGGGYGGFNNYANAILRQDAMAVPTVARCRNLLAGTIATIPLQTYATATGASVPNMVWVDQPDIRQPRAVTVAWTVDSLLMYGVAYWQVTEIYKEDGRPARFEWVQNDRVTPKYNATSTEIEYYSLNNVRLPMSGIGSLVTFQALDQGLLLKSQSTIKAALDIERAAAIAAQTPMATSILKNTGADLPENQVQALLASWKQARLSKSTAYLTSTITAENMGFSPKDMMYNEAKQYLATELARACNVPAFMVDAEVFRGMTYQNILDGRKEFAAYSLAPFYTAIEARLSMDDLTPRGTVIRFAVDETFLRVDPVVRLQVTEKLLELNLINLDQAKTMEGLAPDGSGLPK